MAGQVYLYSTGKWLRWIDPATATWAVRAKVDQRWEVVQQARVAAGAQAAERHSTERHAPKLDRLVPMINGLMVAIGAALQVDDPAVALRQAAMLMEQYREDNGRDFRTEVRTRNLEFGPSAASLLAVQRSPIMHIMSISGLNAEHRRDTSAVLRQGRVA